MLCAVAEISALVLFSVGDSCKVVLIALVCVVIVIDLKELVIVCLPIGPSHELNEIFDLALRVCTIISEIFTIAVIFIGVLEIEAHRKSRTLLESWLLKVTVAYTVWIFLFVIWVFICSAHGKGTLGRCKIGGSNNREGWMKREKKLSAAKVILVVVSVIFVVGTTSFAVAITVGIFTG